MHPYKQSKGSLSLSLSLSPSNHHPKQGSRAEQTKSKRTYSYDTKKGGRLLPSLLPLLCDAMPPPAQEEEEEEEEEEETCDIEDGRKGLLFMVVSCSSSCQIIFAVHMPKTKTKI